MEGAISWERVGAIFGDPQPPRVVWERQFDFMDDELRRLARTPYEEIQFSDLSYYFHDLAYAELQPELFAYLFPVCLMDWHRSLRQNESCAHGDAEFHYGVLRGDVFQKMMTSEQRLAVFEFFRDSVLQCLDSERVLARLERRTRSFYWINRLNSLAIVMPRIELIWAPWWSLDTPGRAIAALQYCSGLMYFDGENPLCEEWKGMSPELWSDDSGMIHGTGWCEENVDFVARTLTLEFVQDRVAAAISRLEGHPEWNRARRLQADLPQARELIEIRIGELPTLLRNSDTGGWSL